MYTFNIWHTHALGQDLTMHVKSVDPVTLTLTSESVFRFQNLLLGSNIVLNSYTN